MGNGCRDLAPAPYALYSSLWILLAVSFPSSIYSIRKDIGIMENPVYRTIVQGRYLLSDDNGYVCTALSVDSWTRCCPAKGDQFSWAATLFQCCNSYEYCVSCCLDPSRTKKDLALRVNIAKPISAGTYSSVFDFSAGRCRHNSASVSQILKQDYLVLTLLLEVCSSRGKSCIPNRLLLLDRCDFLQKYMNCKSGCAASIGSDQPAEVVEDAPKNMNPGGDSLLSCHGSHQHSKRSEQV